MKGGVTLVGALAALALPATSAARGLAWHQGRAAMNQWAKAHVREMGYTRWVLADCERQSAVRIDCAAIMFGPLMSADRGAPSISEDPGDERSWAWASSDDETYSPLGAVKRRGQVSARLLP